jgi:hypothetical protein
MNDAIKAGFSQGNQVAGVEQIAGPDSKLLVYPNPARGHINISWANDDKIYELAIIAADGREVEVLKQQIIAIEDVQISTLDWAAGVYTIIAKGQNGSVRQMILKQ